MIDIKERLSRIRFCLLTDEKHSNMSNWSRNYHYRSNAVLYLLDNLI